MSNCPCNGISPNLHFFFLLQVASKARQECARLQREAIIAKQNEGRPKTKTADSGEVGESVGKRKVKKKIRPVPERLYKRPYFKMVRLHFVCFVCICGL